MQNPFGSIDQIVGLFAPSVPQTQKDIQSIANVTNAVQSPTFQRDVEEAKTAAIIYGSTSLTLQAIATGASIFMAYMAYKNHQINKRRRR